MSDVELIRRRDALEAVAGWEIPSTAIAALPAVTVGVRPLVWVDFDGLGSYRAETPFGPEGFDRMTYSNGDFAGYMIWSEDVDQVLHPTVEAAKAAAQADYNERILAALDMTPSPDLSDPVTVHANMLRGSIAKPTVEQIIHLYGREAFQPMIDAAIAKALEGACLAVSEHADWPEDEHGRTEQVDLFARVINAIREITPAVTPAPDAAAIREAVQGLAAFLDAKHQSYVAAKGRNPADYVSGYSIARDKANAILDLIGPKGGA